MVRLRSLSDCGLDPAFLHLSHADAVRNQFTYFVIDTHPHIPITSCSYWDVIGVWTHGDGQTLVEIRLLHIDEERLDEGMPVPYDALRDAPGHINLGPAALELVIAFFETWVPASDHEQRRALPYFVPISAEDFPALGIPTDPESRFALSHAALYRYVPDEAARVAHEISLLGIWDWSSRSPNTAQMALEFTTYGVQELDEHRPNPLIAPGLGIMRFTLPALEEFLIVLRQWTFT